MVPCGDSLKCPVALCILFISIFFLAAVILVCVTKQLAGSSWTRLAQMLPEMPVRDLPGMSELRGRAYGVGPSQAGCHGSLKRKGVLPLACLSTAGVLVEWEVGL